MEEKASPSRLGRYLLLLSLCAVALLCLSPPKIVRSLGAILSYQWRSHAPTYHDQTLSLTGLRQPVRIHFDPQGVPHIDAKNELDLVRATGYVQAKDRFFQMDLLRRIARGRLSELVGKRPFRGTSSIAFDRAMRAWGMERRAEASWKKASAKEKELLTAFVQGVNAARKRFQYPEYGILRTKPEAFRPSDAYAIGMLNAWSISHNWQQELVRLLLTLHLGADKASKLYPHEPLSKGVSIPLTSPAQPLPPAIAPSLRTLFARPSVPRRPKRRKHKRKPHKRPTKRAAIEQKALRMAAALHATTQFSANSNAWVISGELSRSGKPMLASDPHLSHLLPSILYQQHLRTPQLNVIGATMPGVPYVLIGHNRHVAWGITAAVADAMDLVIEQPHPSKRDEVRNEGSACKLHIRQLHIHARVGNGTKRHTFAIRETCRGPLLNDMYPNLLPKGSPMVAIQWHVGPVNLSMWGRANRAKNVKALYQTLHKLPTPLTTIQAADKAGNIGIFWAGTVPKRAHRGTFPYPGWKRKYQWRKMIPHKEIPFGYNPTNGFFANGNNLLVDPRKSKHVLQIDSAPPYRVNRIKERIGATEQHDLKSFAAIQTDVKIGRAAIVLPAILADINAMTHLSPAMKQARQYLQTWDHFATSTSIGTSLFFSIYRLAISMAMKEKLSPKALHFFLSQRYTTNVTDAWFANQRHIAWDHLDTKAVETRTQIVQRAFRRAVALLRANYGDYAHQWKWGKLHALQMRHAFGGIPLFGRWFNLPKSKGIGALESVWKSHFDMGHPKTPFKTVAGPAYRMIVDLGDIAQSRWIIDTGASGWPGTKHYGDQFQHWRAGKTVPMRYKWREILNTRRGTWLMLPPTKAR